MDKVEYIRDSSGKIIGKQDGQEIRDNNNRRLGRFDEKTGRTMDSDGKFVGWGDQRKRLLS